MDRVTRKLHRAESVAKAQRRLGVAFSKRRRVKTTAIPPGAEDRVEPQELRDEAYEQYLDDQGD